MKRSSRVSRLRRKKIFRSTPSVSIPGGDFVCVAKDGSFMSMPYVYRDPHTLDTPAEYFKEVMSRADFYEETGI